MNNHYMNNNKIIIETPLIKALNFYFPQFKKINWKFISLELKFEIFFCYKKHIFFILFLRKATE